MQPDKIRPFLWFGQNAVEAAEFYVSVFKHAKLGNIMGPRDNAMGVEFEIEGRQFIAFNGGPHYQLTPAVSLFVDCNTQEEVDTLWETLIADGGAPDRCGWLRDRFGLSWQIIPRQLTTLMSDKDPAKAGRVMQAMLGMSKISIADLERAYAG